MTELEQTRAKASCRECKSTAIHLYKQKSFIDDTGNVMMRGACMTCGLIQTFEVERVQVLIKPTGIIALKTACSYFKHIKTDVEHVHNCTNPLNLTCRCGYNLDDYQQCPMHGRPIALR